MICKDINTLSRAALLGFVCVGVLCVQKDSVGQSAGSAILIDDHFEREESNDLMEQVGNGWETNSKKRAKGVKQVDLVDGALKINRAEVADHGVSVTHDASFTDAVISLRFQLNEGDDLGINIADINEKSVHAGHLFVARVRLNQLEVSDLKTGRMNLERRSRRQSGKETKEDQAVNARTTQKRPIQLDGKQWHEMEVRIEGDQMKVTIDGELITAFQSEGIAHPTKSRLRLSVNRNAWVDDVKLVKLN
jgi:hypothetical protein